MVRYVLHLAFFANLPLDPPVERDERIDGFVKKRKNKKIQPKILGSAAGATLLQKILHCRI